VSTLNNLSNRLDALEAQIDPPELFVVPDMESADGLQSFLGADAIMVATGVPLPVRKEIAPHEVKQPFEPVENNESVEKRTHIFSTALDAAARWRSRWR
jgi:hypothetical protein